MVEVISRLIVLAILISLSAFFSGVEVALVATNQVKVKQFLNENSKGAKALDRLNRNPERMIITVLIGNNLVNIAAAALATELSIVMFGSIGVGIATGAMTFFILMFGEITPKAYCRANAGRIALRAAGTIELLSYLFYPIARPLEFLSRRLIRIITKGKQTQRVTEAELKALMAIGVEDSAIEPQESQMIESILRLNDVPTRAVMTPRTRMFCLDARLALKGALPLINQSRYTRIPIIESSKDHIVGIIHAKDVARALESGKINLALKDIAYKPFFVSQEKKIGSLLKEMQGRRSHMAIVVDEFGGVEGLVTLEDLIEEIFGEIMDEKDVSPQRIIRLDKNTIAVHGDTEINEVNHYLNVDLPRGDDYSSVSGLLHDKIRDVPKKSDKIDYGEVTMIVEEVSNTTPVRVKITKKVIEEKEKSESSE